jgi:diaminohydroxyphosphoribosylaminopyrimidine deaminase / 5-amino-6-(5-phosphoribosylamino)uracil reductase
LLLRSSSDLVAPEDLRHLRRALALAARGRFRTSPNPMVGAVLVKDGEVVGEGFHRQVGAPHAEVEALRRAGARAQGATLYVSLEPCAHFGRTPPCADATIAAGIKRVLACHRDPDPRVKGGGFARLRAAGIEVASGFLVERAVELNWRYLTATLCKRPAVTLKWAMSLDGRIATHAGDSQWISSPEGRRWALELREDHDAILVGSGTALADDPRLDRRLGKALGANTRVILDRRLRLPLTAAMLDVPGPILVYTSPASDGAQVAALEARGATVVQSVPVEPEAVLADLYERGIRSVLVEGGGEVAAAFVERGAFDRVTALCGPLLIGGCDAKGPIAGLGFHPLQAAPRLSTPKVERFGRDVVLTAFRTECLQVLSASVVD